MVARRESNFALGFNAESILEEIGFAVMRACATYREDKEPLQTRAVIRRNFFSLALFPFNLLLSYPPPFCLGSLALSALPLTELSLPLTRHGEGK